MGVRARARVRIRLGHLREEKEAAARKGGRRRGARLVRV